MRLIDADKMAKEVTEAFYDVQIGRELDEWALKIITFVHKGIQDCIADTDTVDVNDLEIVQHLREISEARGRLIEKYKARFDEAIREREAAKRVIKDLVIMFGIKITDPTQANRSLANQTDDDVVEALIRGRF